MCMISLYFMRIVVGYIMLTCCYFYCQAIPSSGIDNYNLVDALESRILTSCCILLVMNMDIMIHECWIGSIDFIIIDISKVDENQLVLYAQMANLVNLILPSLEIDLKEIAHTFSKVIPGIVFHMIITCLQFCTLICYNSILQVLRSWIALVI